MCGRAPGSPGKIIAYLGTHFAQPTSPALLISRGMGEGCKAGREGCACGAPGASRTRTYSRTCCMPQCSPRCAGCTVVAGGRLNGWAIHTFPHQNLRPGRRSLPQHHRQIRSAPPCCIRPGEGEGSGRSTNVAHDPGAHLTAASGWPVWG